ncbi:MAG: CDP-diacylglycerol--glycerol-3-phosphate 3-phosphatidyltransferase [Bermanella sp.]
MPLNLPNILTSIRVLLIPLMVAVFYLPVYWSSFGAALVFWVACITDYWDGYLARKMDLMTPFGAFLDPVADKLIVVVSLMIVMERDQTLWITIPALVIVAREIIISALREWMAEMGKRANVAVSNLGKAKTLLQMFAITGMLAIEPSGSGAFIASDGWYAAAIFFLVAAAVLTFWSMLSYLRAAWPELSASKA